MIHVAGWRHPYCHWCEQHLGGEVRGRLNRLSQLGDINLRLDPIFMNLCQLFNFSDTTPPEVELIFGDHQA